ncbi:hypothetical protein SLE2022_111050 [Rubroshorea leprosula]
MQSGRNEAHGTLPPAVMLQNRHMDEIDHDPHQGSGIEVVKQSLQRWRNVSPPVVDGPRGILVRERRSGSIEKQEYAWHYSSGRSKKERPRLPSYRHMHKIAHSEEEIVNRKCEYDPMDFEHGTSSRSRHVYRHNHGTSRISKENHYLENRFVSVDGHAELSQKLMPVEDAEIRGSRQLPSDLGLIKYGKTGGSPPSSSKGMDIDPYEHEKLCHWDSVALDKLMPIESYEGEKHMFHSRDVSDSMMPASQSKDFARTSSSIARNEFPSSYRGNGAPLSLSGEYPRSSGEVAEPVGFSTYKQRVFADSVRKPPAARRNVTFYQRVAYSPVRADTEDYSYGKPGEMVIDDCRYPPEDLNRMMPPQTQVNHDHITVDYGHDHITVDYGHRHISRPSILCHGANRIDGTHDSKGNSRKRSIWDHPSMQKQTISEYIDVNKSSASKQAGEYLGLGDNCLEFGRSENYGASHFEASQDLQASNFGRGAGPEFQKTRSHYSPLSKHDSEIERMDLKTQIMKEKEFHMYEASDRIIKRKYAAEEDLCRPSFKNAMPNKLTASQDFEGAYEGDEWVYEEMSCQQYSQILGTKEYRKVGSVYEEQDHRADLTSDDWYATEDSLVPAPRPGIRFFKDSGKFVKGNSRHRSLSWHASNHRDRRSNLQRQIKVWKRNDYYDEDQQANDCDISKDLANLPKSEPSEETEETEEFKQLVNEAFLKYSKMLNMNQTVRRRYKELGKAGSLFCIVCGRSYSKEFIDTQRLVNHAFMSHKVGLRAQHLGLHKAVCVLLGWDTTLPLDTVTWVPQVLPEAEAVAQKEDLILWPPIVVIHNISMSNNIPQEQKVIPMEGVLAYLRGKGFITGRVNVSLGRPADQSVMVIKFLGTFPGLANTEKLHKYFSEIKRGRVDFQRITSNDGKSSSGTKKGKEGNKMEEQLLYGYMAISEDLDKLDFNNRKWSEIKSRKEIQELANDPVKVDGR